LSFAVRPLTLARNIEFARNVHEVRERASVHFLYHLTSVSFNRDLLEAKLKSDLLVQ